MLCEFFIKGYCKFGRKCRNEHIRGICRNFYFRSECFRGAKCYFSHNYRAQQVEESDFDYKENTSEEYPHIQHPLPECIGSNVCFLSNFINPKKPISEYTESDWFDISDQFECFAECDDVNCFTFYLDKYIDYDSFDWGFALNKICKYNRSHLLDLLLKKEKFHSYLITEKGEYALNMIHSCFKDNSIVVELLDLSAKLNKGKWELGDKEEKMFQKSTECWVGVRSFYIKKLISFATNPEFEIHKERAVFILKRIAYSSYSILLKSFIIENIVNQRRKLCKDGIS